MKVSKTYTYEFSFSQNQVDLFASLTGDTNPVHIDESFASKTKFGRRILPGFLVGSIFSKVFGTMYPGYGTFYLRQNMSFYKPMFPDVKYQAYFEIIEVYEEKARALVKTIIQDGQGEELLIGEALIKHEVFGNKELELS